MQRCRASISAHWVLGTWLQIGRLGVRIPPRSRAQLLQRRRVVELAPSRPDIPPGRPQHTLSLRDEARLGLHRPADNPAAQPIRGHGPKSRPGEVAGLRHSSREPVRQIAPSLRESTSPLGHTTPRDPGDTRYPGGARGSRLRLPGAHGEESGSHHRSQSSPQLPVASAVALGAGDLLARRPEEGQHCCGQELCTMDASFGHDLLSDVDPRRVLPPFVRRAFSANDKQRVVEFRSSLVQVQLPSAQRHHTDMLSLSLQ